MPDSAAAPTERIGGWYGSSPPKLELIHTHLQYQRRNPEHCHIPKLSLKKKQGKARSSHFRAATKARTSACDDSTPPSFPHPSIHSND